MECALFENKGDKNSTAHKQAIVAVWPNYCLENLKCLHLLVRRPCHISMAMSLAVYSGHARLAVQNIGLVVLHLSVNIYCIHNMILSFVAI